MVACGTVTLLFCVTSLLLFSVKKTSYVTCDGISKSFSEEDMGELLKETFVSSSLWLMKRKGEVYIKSSNHSTKLPSFLCCCDVHPLPGSYIKQLQSLYKHRGLKIFQQDI